MEFEYTPTHAKGATVTFDDAKKTKAFDDLMNTFPLEVVSTPRQIKSSTIVFGIPTTHVIDVEKRFAKSGAKYMSEGFGVSATGYIRRFFLNGGQAQMIGKFDSTTIQGWEEAFRKIKKLFEDYKKTIEANGGKLISTPEERHKYRGLIKGHKFGL